MNRGFFRGRCASADPDVLRDHFSFGVLPVSEVRIDKSASTNLPDFDTLPAQFVVSVRGYIRFLCSKPMVQAVVSERSTSIRALRRRDQELHEAARYAAIGVGVSAVADMLVALGAVAMAGAAVAALSLVMSAWAAALIVGLALWTGAGVVVLVNRLHIWLATPKPATPTQEPEIHDITEMPLWWNVNNRYASPRR